MNPGQRVGYILGKAMLREIVPIRLRDRAPPSTEYDAGGLIRTLLMCGRVKLRHLPNVLGLQVRIALVAIVF